MIFNLRSILFIVIAVLIQYSSVVAESNVEKDLAEKLSDSGLDISAEQVDLNFQSAIRRLQGNVLLKHQDIIVRGDFAEVQSDPDNNPIKFIISGTPVNFEQKVESIIFNATTSQLIYIPSQELIEFQENVSVFQKTDSSTVEINAEDMQLLLKQGVAYEFNAKGSPASFIHQLTDKKITINAQEIMWNTQTQIAILLQATVIDGPTAFSADKIEYNTMTGGLSASGDGEQRPSYRYDAKQPKEQLNDVDNSQ